MSGPVQGKTKKPVVSSVVVMDRRAAALPKDVRGFYTDKPTPDRALKNIENNGNREIIICLGAIALFAFALNVIVPDQSGDGRGPTPR